MKPPRLLRTVHFLLAAISAASAVICSGANPHPAVVDNSQSKYFPPLALQGRVASCDWFAAVYYQMTYMENRQQNRAADPTNIFSPKFGFTLVNCGSTWPTNLWFPDLYEFLKRHGSPTVADMPYDLAEGQHFREWCTNADVWQSALAHRIVRGEFIHFNLDRIRDLLASGEVLVIQCFPYDCDFARAQDNPASTNDDQFIGDAVLVAGRPNADHTMAVVGYNDAIWADANGNGTVESDECGAIRIADSAEGRGINNGYRWIAYRAMSDPTNSVIFEGKFWRIHLQKNYRPKVVARVTLNTARRDKLKMQLGRAATPDPAAAKESKRVFDPYAVGFSPGLSGRSLIAGGDCSFGGAEGSADGSFAFDLTDLLAGDPVGKGYWYFRLLNEGDQQVEIKSFEVLDLETGSNAKDENLPVSFEGGEQFRFVRFQAR